jgi:GrpB-like predicted nucleotidyltransferase (UPF0157 family)
MDKSIIVVAYDENWRAEFERIKKELLGAIGDLAIAIEHVGSTSVEGLPAKPIIDIDLVIKSYNDFEDLKAKLDQIGYTHRGDLGIKDRQAFGYEGKAHLMKHHLYVCPQYSEELKRHMTFRDYLRSHPEDRDWYGQVKTYAARAFPKDIDNYLTAKEPCIAELYRRCGLIGD